MSHPSLRFAWLLAGALLAAAVCWSPVAAAQSAADVAAARELFKEAAQLSKDGRWDEAKDRLRRSLALRPAPITHYSLGVAQQQTGELVEALESLRAFLIAPVEPGTETYREPATRAVAELEQRVSRLVITVEPSDVSELTISIDGVEVPPEAADHPRLVNPGRHVVSAAAPGYHASRESVEVGEGGSANVTLRLEATPRDARVDTPEPLPADRQDGPSMVGPVVLLSVGAAALGAGIAVGMIGLNEAEDAPTSDGEQAEEARTKGIAGDIVAGVGGTTAAAGLVWLIVALASDGAEVAPDEAFIQPRGAGIQLRF